MKRAIIKEVIQSFKVNLLLLQETKLRSTYLPLVREIWGSSHCNWISLEAEGTSGGILLSSNSRSYSIKDHYIGSFSVSAVMEDRENGST